MDGIAEAVREFSIAELLVFTSVPLAIMLISGFRAFRLLRWRRMLQDLPTSRTRSAHQGYVELAGPAQMMEGPTIQTPITRLPCVWWSLVTERADRKGWTPVEREQSDELFFLRDADGTCVVDPDGAKVTCDRRRVTRGQRSSLSRLARSGQRLRHVERYILEEDELHIVGWFKTFNTIEHWDHDDELREKLRDWKNDQEALIRRFDVNKDGQIDQQEWAQARKEAKREISQEHRELSVQPGVNVIGAPADGRPFLIAGEHEQLFTRRLDRQTIGAAVIAVLMGTLTLFILATRL